MKSEGTMRAIPEQAIGKKFGVRTLAYIIDQIVYILSVNVAAAVGVVPIALVFLLLGREAEFDNARFESISFVVGLVLFVLYYAIFEWLYGASLGKIILQMRVVQENGEPCGLKAALTRGLFRYFDGLLFGLPAYTNMKQPLFQRIGDKSAKTLVVSSKNPMIRDRRSGWWFLVAAGLYFALAVSVQMLEEIASLR